MKSEDGIILLWPIFKKQVASSMGFLASDLMGLTDAIVESSFCKSAQGLSVHKMQVHGERAPESKYLESPLCPVCMKWFCDSA